MNTEKIKILLVDDNVFLGSLLKQFLETKNFLVTQTKNGEEAFDLFRIRTFDLCLLDIVMPLMDGITLAKKIKTKSEGTPIIFITANSKKEDIIEGFNVGADDYITKPYELEEILVRINAVLRRTVKKESTNENSTEFTIGKYVFNSLTQNLISKEGNCRLTTKEAQLLHLLVLNKNELLVRSFALKTIWHDSDYFKGRSMDIFITKLRKYLKDDSSLSIENVRGKGFKLLIKP
jgi:two-component system OmpR family response regulator